jgi:hypothetical protein
LEKCQMHGRPWNRRISMAHKPLQPFPVQNIVPSSQLCLVCCLFWIQSLTWMLWLLSRAWCSSSSSNGGYCGTGGFIIKEAKRIRCL